MGKEKNKNNFNKMKKIRILKYLYCIMVIYLCFSCSQNSNIKLKSNDSKDTLAQYIKSKEGGNSFFYTNIISLDKRCALRGYSFVKNDTLYFVKLKTNMMNFEKYPLCLVEKKSRINSSFVYNFVEFRHPYHYNSDLIFSTHFGSEYFYFFKNYTNACDFYGANCTKKNSELMVAQRTAFFVYSNKKGIFYFDYYLAIGVHLPYLS